MKQRGKQKSAELRDSVITRIPERPGHPNKDTATDGELQVWKRVVDSMPVDWFRPEQLDLLTNYCFYVDRCKQIRQQLAHEGLEECNFNLSKELDSCAKQVTSLATKMRLTHQSRYQANTASRKTDGGARKAAPWES